ncbi:Type III restriction enzyme [Aphelenchoides fujianensis]|nr:Type III restriction enzyme [Aphelenchoides fujianensis]
MSAEAEPYGRVVDGEFRHHPPFLRLFRRELDALLDRPAFFAEFAERLADGLPPISVNAFERRAAKRGAELCVEDVPGEEPRRLDYETKREYWLVLRKVPPAVTDFWYWLQRSLQDGIREQGGDPWLLAMLEDKPDPEEHEGETVQHFDRFFASPRTLDLLVDVLWLPAFIHDLGELNVEAYEQRVLQLNVVPVFERYPNDHHYAACEAMRRMFYAQPGVVANKKHSWYWDFIDVLTKHPNNRPLLELVDREYEKPWFEYVTYLKASEQKLLVADVADLIDADAEFTTPFRTQRPDFELSEVEFEGDEFEAVELREYQKELVRHANAGKNALICAPTGSGKTVVAVQVIVEHFRRVNFATDGVMKERARVVFLVPSVPLVEQQTKLIRKYVSGTQTVAGFHGGDGRNANLRLGEILAAHVVVITPQLLLNMLQSVFKAERLFVSDFTLFVFDECHHCGANQHPYNVLMQLVRAYCKNATGRQPPQVVGLTASLGAGKSAYLDPQVTEEHMLRLCVRMMAERISTVYSRHGLAELERFVSPPIDTIETVQRPEHDRFASTVAEAMHAVHELIRYTIACVRQQVEELTDFRLPERIDEHYINVVERLFESSNRWPAALAAEKHQCVMAIDVLRIYVHTLRMNDLLPACYAFDYLQKKMEQYGAWFAKLLTNGASQAETELGEQLIETFSSRAEHLGMLAREDTGAAKQILRKLVGVLAEEYARNADTRTMIFVEQRATTHALSQFLACSRTMAAHFTDESVRALTSTNQASKYGGLTTHDQKIILDGFARGVVKALVVTSVAEEGLDVSSCNLIIKYNVVGSERTLIQRRGRARALDSRSVLLALDGNVERREVENIHRERVMHACLRNLQAKSEQQLSQQIAAMSARVHDEEELAERERTSALRQLAAHVYEIQCNGCNTYVCLSTEIRCINNTCFVCVQPNVWARIAITNGEAVKGLAETNIAAACAPFTCKKCARALGSVIAFGSIFLPALAAPNLRFVERRARAVERSGVTWKMVAETMCTIAECNQQNLLDMAPSLQESSAEDFQHLRERHAEAIQQQIDALKLKRQRRTRFNLAEYEQGETHW